MKDYNENIRQSILDNRFGLWRDFLANLERTAEPDHTVVRFPNSSSYIFSTGNCFWMVDPAYTYQSDGLADEIRQLGELLRQKTAFILITHLHADHCQSEWVKMLADSKVEWVISDRIAADFFGWWKASPANTYILEDDTTIELAGIRITARPGYHCEPGKPPVHACAYDVELPDGVKLFFPGDVRDPSREVPQGEVDYTFGHVFLGREDATGNDFPHLEAVSRFLARRKSSHLFLNHLYEIGRNPPDLWTHRHAEMIKEQLRSIAPEMQVTAPHFGDAIHLTKAGTVYPDIFQNWNKADQDDFLENIGISIKMDHNDWMAKAIDMKIQTVEWSFFQLNDISVEELQKQADDWRKAGGKNLSIHFPNFPWEDDANAIEYFRKNTEIACAVKADRVTIHIPHCILGEAAEKLDGILDFCAGLLPPLLNAGIRVGIENLHMKPFFKADESRPMGFIPSELLTLVNGLRERCHSELIGCHLDIGHAYSNYPYSEEFDMTEWLNTCGELINGMHLHQFEYAATPEKPYLTGHALISGRNIGHPNLYPLYKAWAEKKFRAPMFLEICRDAELQPFSSISRMRYIWGK